MLSRFSTPDTLVGNHLFVFDQASGCRTAGSVFYSPSHSGSPHQHAFTKSPVCLEFFHHFVHGNCCINMILKELISSVVHILLLLLQNFTQLHCDLVQGHHDFFTIVTAYNYYLVFLQILRSDLDNGLEIPRISCSENFHPVLLSESSIFTLYPAFFSSSRSA